MIPIAVVLLLIVAVFSIAVVVSNPGVQDLSIFGASIPVNDAGVYFTGAGAMLVLILALQLLRTGARREMARRKEIRALKSAAGEGTEADAAEQDASEPAAVRTTGAYGGEVESSSHSDDGTPPDNSTSDDISSDDSAPRTSTEEPKQSSLDLPGDAEQPRTTAAERRALLDETDELTGDPELTRGTEHR